MTITLEVFVPGDPSDARILTVPFEVFDSEGNRIGQGVAAPAHPARMQISIDAKSDRVHVVGKLPNDTRIERTVSIAGSTASVELPLITQSPHEWLAWATPFRSLAHLRDVGPSDHLPTGVGDVWMTTWRRHGDHFVATDGHDLNASISWKRRSALLVELNVPSESCVVQLGGDRLAWRMVALPPRSNVRIAVTKASSPDGDSVNVTVARSNATDELIMSYLTRGAASEASRLCQAWEVADRMLYDKFNDPVSAVAGAYTLLKLGRLQLRRDWVHNLSRSFPYIADGAILAAALESRSAGAHEGSVRDLCVLAVHRGPPVFTLGMSLLLETMSAVVHEDDEHTEFGEAYQRARMLYLARCSSGAYFAFHGANPNEPLDARFYGRPDGGSVRVSRVDLPEAELVLGLDEDARNEKSWALDVNVPQQPTVGLFSFRD